MRGHEFESAAIKQRNPHVSPSRNLKSARISKATAAQRSDGKAASASADRSPRSKYVYCGVLLLLIVGISSVWYQYQISRIRSSRPRINATDAAQPMLIGLQDLSRDDLETLLSLPAPELDGFSSFKIDTDFWTQTIDDAFQSLKAAYPEDPQVEHLFGLVQLRLNRTKLAEPSLKRSLELDQDNIQIRTDLAKLYLQLGRDNEAIDVLLPLKKLQQLPAETVLLMGDCLQRLGRLEEAEQTFSTAAKLHANSSDAWTKLARVQLQQQKLQESQRSVDTAIKLDSQNAELWLLLNQILTLQKKPQEAAIALQRWQEQKERPSEETLELSFEAKHSLSMARVFSSSFRSMAALYQTHGGSAAAHRMYESAVKVNPLDAAALTAWASQFRKEGNISKAIEFNRRLLQLQPQEPAHYQNYANLCMEATQPREAEAALRLACMNLPNDGKMHLLLARFLLLLNKPVEAVAPARTASQILRSGEAEEVLSQAERAAAALSH